ncbi:MAG: hypothetical protein VXW71_00295 [Actinomycetota bacterium]|nr:hypothetical protein [Actinomycetota bacterium]
MRKIPKTNEIEKAIADKACPISIIVSPVLRIIHAVDRLLHSVSLLSSRVHDRLVLEAPELLAEKHAPTTVGQLLALPLKRFLLCHLLSPHGILRLLQ